MRMRHSCCSCLLPPASCLSSCLRLGLEHSCECEEAFMCSVCAQVGQRQGGFFGLCETLLSRGAKHIWFERTSAEDRSHVVKLYALPPAHASNRTHAPRSLVYWFRCLPLACQLRALDRTGYRDALFLLILALALAAAAATHTRLSLITYQYHLHSPCCSIFRTRRARHSSLCTWTLLHVHCSLRLPAHPETYCSRLNAA